MILCDAHCHLYDVENLESEIKKCIEMGFKAILCVSEDLETMEKTLKIRDKFGEIIYPGLGIHPAVVSLSPEEEIENAFNFLKNHIKDTFCIGEIGLDFKYVEQEKDKEKQYFWLQEQLKLAKDEKKPINLHSRRALRETLKVAIDFHKETGLNALLHWFTHSKKLIKIAMEKGIYVSAGPSIL
ncbi:MAG: TatD family hydrolase, partial [Thermoanaerobaculia bacterium]